MFGHAVYGPYGPRSEGLINFLGRHRTARLYSLVFLTWQYGGFGFNISVYARCQMPGRTLTQNIPHPSRTNVGLGWISRVGLGKGKGWCLFLPEFDYMRLKLSA